MPHKGESAEPMGISPAEMAAREIRFTFEGKSCTGRSGDSIAKTLFLNGIRVLSHSVKFGRARGISCGRGRCVMCLVEVNGVSGVRACVTPLADGMVIRRQDYKPFYASWLTAVTGRLPFPAGFYFRYFNRPKLLHRTFLRIVRRMVGVGKLSISVPVSVASPGMPASALSELKPRYDVAVVGAGLSGMASAMAAADTGATVLLVDEYSGPGGHSVGCQGDTGLARARDELIRQINAHPAIKTSFGTSATAFYPSDTLLLGPSTGCGADDSPGIAGTRRIRAGSFIFATGAMDLIPLFENNDLPGIFGLRALRLFLERDQLIPGHNAVVYGAGQDLAAATDLLRSKNVRVAALVDAGPATIDETAGETCRRISGKVVQGRGRGWIREVSVASTGGKRSKITCDMLCIASPGQPTYDLAYQAGFEFGFEENGTPADLAVMKPKQMKITESRLPGLYLVGETAGHTIWQRKLDHASETGAAAAARAVTP